MAKDFDTSSDMIPEVGSEVSRDTGADYGGDIASDDGVDLNAGDATKADGGFAKATMMSYDASLPEDYTADGTRPPDSAIYTEAPARPSLEDQYPGWNITDGTSEASGQRTPQDVAEDLNALGEYAGPAEESHPDSLIVEEPVAEQHPPDPPEGSESSENDTNETR